MKRSILLLTAAVFMLFSCGNQKKESQNQKEKEVVENNSETELGEASEPNTLTEKEKENGWRLLFNGEDNGNWRGYDTEEFPTDWKVRKGTLFMAGSGRGEAGSENGGDILYDEKFDNFHLKLEWKISEGGNSGIFYLGQESDDFDYIWETAPEMQVLDNKKHPDAMLGENGNRQAGSLYDLYPAKPQNAKPAGEWNKVEIIVYDGTVVHKQNGKTVVEYHLWTPKWKKDVADSKFPELNEDWADVAKEGYVGLQDHGDDIWFRDIKIKEL